MIKKYFYPFDLSITDIWGRITDFWENFADKKIVEEFWKGYKLLFDEHLGKLSYFLNLSRSLEYVEMCPELKWYLFFFEAGKAKCRINPNIYNIASLQDTRENPSTILIKDVGFTISEENERKYIILTAGPIFEDIWLWAPTIEYDMRRVIYNFFGCLFPLVDYKLFTPEQYRIVLQTIFWYSFKGPSLENFGKIAASLCELTQTRYKGKVQSITPGTINDTIIIRDEAGRDDSYFVPTGQSAVSENDSVTRFESLQNGITVKDFKTDPNWWVGVWDINEIQARNIVYVGLSGSAASSMIVSSYVLYTILQFLLPKRCRLQLDIPLPLDAAVVWDHNQTNRTNNVQVPQNVIP